jgi:hypothetical protein
LAVGAPGASAGTGAVYLFGGGPSGWAQSVRIAPPSPEELLFFGYSVALGDGLLAAGSPRFRHFAGAVDLYAGSGGSWQPLPRLELGPDRNRQFGFALSLFGDRLVVGAPGPGLGEELDLDQAFLFERGADVWTQTAAVDATQVPEELDDRFGSAVALSRTFFAVGNPFPPRGDRVTVFSLRDAAAAAGGVQ